MTLVTYPGDASDDDCCSDFGAVYTGATFHRPYDSQTNWHLMANDIAVDGLFSDCFDFNGASYFTKGDAGWCTRPGAGTEDCNVEIIGIPGLSEQNTNGFSSAEKVMHKVQEDATNTLSNLQVLTSNGQVVFRCENCSDLLDFGFTSNDWKSFVTLNLPPGIYFLSFVLNGEHQSEKIFIQPN